MCFEICFLPSVGRHRSVSSIRVHVFTLGTTATTVISFANSSNASHVTSALADLSHGFAPVSSLEAGLLAVTSEHFWARAATDVYVDRIVVVLTHASTIANPAVQTQAAGLKALQVRLAFVSVPSTARTLPSAQLATALRNAASQPPPQHYNTFASQAQLLLASARAELVVRMLDAVAIVSYDVSLSTRQLTVTLSRNVAVRSFNPTYLSLGTELDADAYVVRMTNVQHVTNSSARDTLQITLDADDATALQSQTALLQAASTTLLSTAALGLVADRAIVASGGLTPRFLQGNTPPFGVGALTASNVTARSVQLSWESPVETGGSLTRQQLWCNASVASPLIPSGT